jgi:hypothetical protein
MHLAFRYLKSRKAALTLYNALVNAGKEAFMSYDPATNKYFVRFYEPTR